MVILASFSIQGRTVEALIDAKFFPRFIGALIMSTSLFTIFSGLRGMKNISQMTKDPGERQDKPLSKEKTKPVLMTFALLCAYALLLESLGFILTSSLYLVLQFIVLSKRERWNFPLFIGIAASVSLLVYFVFLKAFNLMLPSGILG